MERKCHRSIKNLQIHKVIIDSANGFLPIQCEAISLTNAD